MKLRRSRNEPAAPAQNAPSTPPTDGGAAASAEPRVDVLRALVDNLDEALAGRKVIVQPFFPMEGVRAAFIDDGGAPVEYLEFRK